MHCSVDKSTVGHGIEHQSGEEREINGKLYIVERIHAVCRKGQGLSSVIWLRESCELICGRVHQ